MKGSYPQAESSASPKIVTTETVTVETVTQKTESVCSMLVAVPCLFVDADKCVFPCIWMNTNPISNIMMFTI